MAAGIFPRSYLFVPATRPERFDKALAAGADAVIIDLEDAVEPEAKARAREALAAWLKPSHHVLVRINGAGTPWFRDDLSICGLPGVESVVLPKAESHACLDEVSSAGARSIHPLIETAVGIDDVKAIARAPNVRRLMFGSIDFQVDLGIPGDHDELLYFRSQIVLASRLGGLPPPVDGVSLGIDDVAALEADTRRARLLGFGAKLCIHPKQVAAVNRGFAPAQEEVRWARRVLEAAAKSAGAAVQVDGRMVDLPVVARAERIVREVERGGG